MAITNPVSKWHNFALWSVISAIVGVMLSMVITALKNGGALYPMIRSQEVITSEILTFTLSSLLAGFALKRFPISMKGITSFLVLNVVAVLLVVLTLWGFDTFNGNAIVMAMNGSEKTAAIVGIAFFIFALMIAYGVIVAHRGAWFMRAEHAEIIRDSTRETVYAVLLITTKALMLILLSLAKPGGLLSPNIVLAIVAVLLAAIVVLTLALWRLMDELSRTLTLESRNAAFYLIVMIGGLWSILSHLGFVAAPAPLDWLTLFIVIWFVANFIAVGRRGLLKH